MEINNKQIISDFVTKNQEKTISFLLKTFSFLKYHDCEDIFQDSLLIFHEKIVKGELDNIKSSLYTNLAAKLARLPTSKKTLLVELFLRKNLKLF